MKKKQERKDVGKDYYHFSKEKETVFLIKIVKWLSLPIGAKYVL